MDLLIGVSGLYSNSTSLCTAWKFLMLTIMKSKMNYRAWNHRGWLVSYMAREQMLHELQKSRDWAGLHVADNSCFHYRRGHEGELDFSEVLIKRYIGREALWIHHHFMSLCLIRHVNTMHGISCHSVQKTSMDNEINIILDNELCLLSSCSAIQDTEFEDFEAQAMYSAIYILWLTKQIPQNTDIELQSKLKEGNLKTMLPKTCPERSFLWHISDLKGSFE
ncbi:hypothetical protein PTKIN_Ptkin01aG0350100 [Pterospermum kingtungense]